jgi:hypothetical protein
MCVKSLQWKNGKLLGTNCSVFRRQLSSLKYCCNCPTHLCLLSFPCWSLFSKECLAALNPSNLGTYIQHAQSMMLMHKVIISIKNKAQCKHIHTCEGGLGGPASLPACVPDQCLCYLLPWQLFGLGAPLCCCIHSRLPPAWHWTTACRVWRTERHHHFCSLDERKGFPHSCTAANHAG